MKSEKIADPHLVIAASFHIKNGPRPGYAGGSYTFGKERVLPLATMLAEITETILEHYAVFSTVEAMNQQLDLFRRYMVALSMQESEEE